jgi:hypothetical protein
MRSKLTLCLIVSVATLTFAKQPKQYQRGKLLQMDSVSCGLAGNDVANSAGDTLGSTSEKTQALSCQEYVLQAEHVTYRIRPRDGKHPVLLPVGDDALFRLEKNRMLLRSGDLDQKEREYVVISMSPRSEGSTADAAPVHLNHLQ